MICKDCKLKSSESPNMHVPCLTTHSVENKKTYLVKKYKQEHAHPSQKNS